MDQELRRRGTKPLDSTGKPARQGGALHKTVARPAENAYFARARLVGTGPCETRPELMAATSEPITIKRYANRRLYNPSAAGYVSLDQLAMMLEDGEDFVVYEAGTGEDITRLVLKQIIVQRGNHG